MSRTMYLHLLEGRPAGYEPAECRLRSDLIRPRLVADLGRAEYEQAAHEEYCSSRSAPEPDDTSIIAVEVPEDEGLIGFLREAVCAGMCADSDEKTARDSLAYLGRCADDILKKRDGEV